MVSSFTDFGEFSTIDPPFQKEGPLEKKTASGLCRVLKGSGCSRGGGNWGTLRIPAGKIGEP